MSQTDAELRELLGLERIAVVGCSRMPGKAAHDVPRYLQRHGYEIVPVNPNADEVLGRETYDSLVDVEERVDLVCLFRPSDEVAGVVQEVLEREDVDVVWTQLGIRDDEAARRVRESGRRMVQDRCMKVEHARLVG